MMNNEINVTGEFFFDCGLYFKYYLGNIPMKNKHLIIKKFKKFIESYGGQDKFIGPQQAVTIFLKEQKNGKKY